MISSYIIYEVTINNNNSIREGFDEFRNEKYNSTKTMTGRELLQLISRELNDTNINEFGLIDNKIIICKFNPFNGETEETEIQIKAIKSVFDKEE